MIRRTFIKNAATIGLVSSFQSPRLSDLQAESARLQEMPESNISLKTDPRSAIGCPVRIVSFGYKVSPPPSLDDLKRQVDHEAANGIDLIVLPEACQGQMEEPLHGRTVSAMSELAKRHHTYIAAPIFRLDSDSRAWNSIVFVNRNGEIVCLYDKIYPFFDEYSLPHPVHPGKAECVYKTDFGKIGFATCFDVNFPEVWRGLADKGADLVIWPSAYSGGTALQAHALNHHYYIVTASRERDCLVYDITGQCILREKTSDPVKITRITLDLDRSIYHYNYNGIKKKRLLEEHPDDVMQETTMESEEWFVLKAKRPGVKARELAHQYGLEELRHYVQRSRAEIDKRRGFSFTNEAYCW